jgi:lysophospholipase L1-like esterase
VGILKALFTAKGYSMMNWINRALRRGLPRNPTVAGLLVFAAALGVGTAGNEADAKADERGTQWIGTWATSAQPSLPDALQTYQNQSLRLIVHTSASGAHARIKISNTYGDEPLFIGGAHIARRSAGADIDPASDRRLTFGGHSSITVPARSVVESDPVDLDVPALSDLAISLFFPKATKPTTSHALALQTSYLSPATGDSTADAKFAVAKTIDTWPFLTGVDVAASPAGMAIVAFGSSTTDGDGSSLDANRRWPDVLAERLQKHGTRTAEVGVLNQGIIGNRLLSDSPSYSQFGAALGEAGLARFDVDVLDQAGVKYLIVGLGINDIVFPGLFTPLTEMVNSQSMLSGYRQLIVRAHQKGIRVIGTTIPPFENATFGKSVISFYTAEKENVRQEVNTWIRNSAEFDGVVDFDAVLRDPNHPTRLLPSYDSGDHLHSNDAGYTVSANAIPLTSFGIK